MPQITLEYSSNISISFNKQEFFKKLHAIVSQEGECKIENCKSRLVEIENYFIGNIENENSAFIHLEVRLLEGKSQETKVKLGKKVLAFLENQFITANENLDVQITVHIIDIERKLYFKYPKGTLTKLK